MLLGRVTYEGMAQAWPSMSGNSYADHVNAIAKYVIASKPVHTAADILIWGTGKLTDALAQAGLLDEYRLWICPVIKGGSEPLFRPASAGTLELLDVTTFPTRRR